MLAQKDHENHTHLMALLKAEGKSKSKTDFKGSGLDFNLLILNPPLAKPFWQGCYHEFSVKNCLSARAF